MLKAIFQNCENINIPEAEQAVRRAAKNWSQTPKRAPFPTGNILYDPLTDGTHDALPDPPPQLVAEGLVASLTPFAHEGH